MREKVDRLKWKVEEVKMEIGVGPKAEEVRSGNGIEQVRLNNVRASSEEGTGKQGEWIKVKGRGGKKIDSSKGIDGWMRN